MDRLIPNALLDALALLLPVACAGCGADDRALCAACRAELAPVAVRQTLSDGMPVVSALRYEATVRQSILALKEHGRTDVARALARPLGFAIGAASEVLDRPVELCAVPSRRSSYRRRGYDPVRLLLRRSGLRPAAPVLVATHATSDQKTLGTDGRWSNLHGSLRAIRPLDGRRFLIVDDVLTTGSTLVEVGRALREAGAEVAGSATLAFTPKHFR